MYRVLVWDVPLRVFHWTLFVAVVAALFTGLQGGPWMAWHGRIGLAIIGLLAFRLVWGLIGSTYARFGQFLPGPQTLRAYLRGHWQGLGHNPLGALSVLALLIWLAAQAGSGLFADDDIAYRGPLRVLTDRATATWLTSWHRAGLWPLLGLLALHLGAVLFYLGVRKKNLIRPMIFGWKETPDPHAQPARGGGVWAFALAVALAGAAVWMAAGGLLPPPVPSVAPDW